MKIVYFSDQYWPVISGVSVSIDSFKNELAGKGNDVYLFTTDYPGAREFDEKVRNRNILRFKSHRLFFNEENRLVNRSEKREVFSALDKIRPDVIHVHTEFNMFRIAVKYARRNKVPLVVTAHTNWEQLVNHYIKFMPGWIGKMYCRFKLRYTYNKADLVIVPTSLMEVLLQSYFIFRPIHVIPTGIDKSEFKRDGRTVHDYRQALIREYPALEGRRILFSLGRLGMEKNITLLIDVVKNILKSRDDIMLVIAGDGPARQELMKYAAEQDLDRHVIFTGYVPRTRIKDYFSAADVFVFASMVESQGMVVLEAMSCGIPVVAVGKMGTREVMGGDFGGFMVDDDPEQFEKKILLLLDDSELHAEKCVEAIEHAAKWGISPLAEKLLKVYESLVQDRN